MIGVVLWSDIGDRKAVVWCEDQGDLAFLSEQAHDMIPDTFFEIGDVLQFDIVLERSYRRASNARLVQDASGMDAVRNLTAVSAVEPEGADIIPFRLDGAYRLKDTPQARPRYKEA